VTLRFVTLELVISGKQVQSLTSWATLLRVSVSLFFCLWIITLDKRKKIRLLEFFVCERSVLVCMRFFFLVNALSNSIPLFFCEIPSIFIGKINLSFSFQLVGPQVNFITKQPKIILAPHFLSFHFWSLYPYFFLIFLYLVFF